MPNGPNCMSFLYRHLVIPDRAATTCESNKFLFCGGTVTYGSEPTANRQAMRSHPSFASSSIIARSVADCRLLRAHFGIGLRPGADFFERRRQDRRALEFGTKPEGFVGKNAVGVGLNSAPKAKESYSKRRISTGKMRVAERAGKIVAAMLINSAAAAIHMASSAFAWKGT
jgi:hypothetical protein